MCLTLLLAELNHTVAILELPNGTFAHKLNHSFFSFVDELGNHFLVPQEFLLGCDCVNPCEEEVRHKAATSIDMSGFMMRHPTSRNPNPNQPDLGLEFKPSMHIYRYIKLLLLHCVH
jgi:hypothetical protein